MFTPASINFTFAPLSTSILGTFKPLSSCKTRYLKLKRSTLCCYSAMLFACCTCMHVSVLYMCVYTYCTVYKCTCTRCRMEINGARALYELDLSKSLIHFFSNVWHAPYTQILNLPADWNLHASLVHAMPIYWTGRKLNPRTLIMRTSTFTTSAIQPLDDSLLK